MSSVDYLTFRLLTGDCPIECWCPIECRCLVFAVNFLHFRVRREIYMTKLFLICPPFGKSIFCKVKMHCAILRQNVMMKSLVSFSSKTGFFVYNSCKFNFNLIKWILFVHWYMLISNHHVKIGWCLYPKQNLIAMSTSILWGNTPAFYGA